MSWRSRHRNFLRSTGIGRHYALYKDLLALKQEGGWSSVALVERYAHLMPAGHEAAIHRFCGVTAREERSLAETAIEAPVTPAL